ncbi:MAG: right-handed parallel beta-helix repeat-containing protein [Pelomonas sp.]|nr:right-handed parallel beta-helix repeat-containing protein [Roseateles sp.]
MEAPARPALRRHLRRLLGALALLLLSGGAALAAAVWQLDATPRELARWLVASRAEQPAWLRGGAQRLALELVSVDRGVQAAATDYPAYAAPTASASAADPKPLRVVRVDRSEALAPALASALPGDLILLAPGRYRFSGEALAVRVPGTDAAPIVVRAATLGEVWLDFALVEGFKVNAPHWRFENLEIHGACRDDSDCEHAFHVVGAAVDTRIEHCRLVDFNAPVKINGESGDFPDAGRIEASELSATRGRATANPVSFIDLVGANGWRIEGNLIADFVKLQGDRVSYGAYAKGAGQGNVFARNLVICEQRLRGADGARVGLSLGGGGSGPAYCRDRACIVEQQAGRLEDNLIAQCSDAGIYLNRAAQSVVSGNRLLDTAGIDGRFPETAADLRGNIVDGPIHTRNDALLHEQDDRASPRVASLAGAHPLRAELCTSVPAFKGLASCAAAR